ncbi:MAG TPA: ornithine cyclodeaminase family protein [Steroidobacteraceae bacterium]|nr:ornithine cyclodeaminase family protein [Steroidobacteraceae bacterium]
MLVLSHADLVGLLAPPDLVAAVEAACRVDEREVLTPKRQHYEWQGNTWLTMPSLGTELAGVKLVSVVSANAARGLPVTNGVMVLSDGATGQPLALLNAAALTAVRTGAVGALGVQHMTPADTRTAGVIGCGVQGAWQAICAAAVRPIAEIFCVARSAVSLERFSATVRQHAAQLRITACNDARELLARTDVVIASTTSSEPVLPDEPGLLEGKHFISVGSYRPSMQELPDAVYQLAGHIVIDSPAAREEVGDVIAPLQRGLVRAEDVFLIGELVTGRRSIDPARTSAYKTVGRALYDLFTARALYEQARARGVGREVPL